VCLAALPINFNGFKFENLRFSFVLVAYFSSNQQNSPNPQGSTAVNLTSVNTRGKTLVESGHYNIESTRGQYCLDLADAVLRLR